MQSQEWSADIKIKEHTHTHTQRSRKNIQSKGIIQKWYQIFCIFIWELPKNSLYAWLIQWHTCRKSRHNLLSVNDYYHNRTQV